MEKLKVKPKKDSPDLKKLIADIEMVVFDFDGVFTDNRVYVMENGREAVACSRADSWGVNLLNKTGVKTKVISTEVNPVVDTRCKKMNIDCIQGCDDKLGALKKEVKNFGLNLNQVAFLGNDTNDLECLKAVGFGVCVADAHESIKDHVKMITNSPGGQGAVRELCDLIIESKNGKVSE